MIPAAFSSSAVSAILLLLVLTTHTHTHTHTHTRERARAARTNTPAHIQTRKDEHAIKIKDDLFLRNEKTKLQSTHAEKQTSRQKDCSPDR